MTYQCDIEDRTAHHTAPPDVVLGDEEADGAGGQLRGARPGCHEGRSGHIRG